MSGHTREQSGVLSRYVDKILRNRRAAAAGGAAVVAGGLTADQIVQAVNRIRFYGNRAAHLSGIDQDFPRLEFGAPEFNAPSSVSGDEEDKAHG